MKYIKILWLAAGMALALVALAGAGTASATKLWSSHSEFTGELRATLASETSGDLTSTGGTVIDTCTTAEARGGAENFENGTVGGPIENLVGGGEGCGATNNQSANGTLETHHISGTTNGTVTATGFNLTVHSSFGECHYGFGSGMHHLGTLTGNTSGTATIHVNAVVTEVEPRRLACPDTAILVSNFVVTTPDNLWVEA